MVYLARVVGVVSCISAKVHGVSRDVEETPSRILLESRKSQWHKIAMRGSAEAQGAEEARSRRCTSRNKYLKPEKEGGSTQQGA